MASSLQLLRRPLCCNPSSARSSATTVASSSSLRSLVSSLWTDAKDGPSSTRPSERGYNKKSSTNPGLGGVATKPSTRHSSSSSSSTDLPSAAAKRRWEQHKQQQQQQAPSTAAEQLLQRVHSATHQENLARAMVHLRELNQTVSSSLLRQTQINNAVLSVLQLCLHTQRTGTEAALELLTLKDLSRFLDYDCVSKAYETINVRDPTTWEDTMCFLRRVHDHVNPRAWPCRGMYRHALRHLAEAGRPEECKWVLHKMVTRTPSLDIGCVGKLHSPAWHLTKAYIYSQQGPAAVQLLQRERGLDLDVDTLNMVLKSLAREKLGPEAAAFLIWGEEEAGVESTVESYNQVAIALAKANGHIIKRSNYSFPPFSQAVDTRPPSPTHAAGEVTMKQNIVLARQMYARMQLRGIQPDMITLCALMNTHSEAGDADGAMTIFFDEMVGKAQLRPTDVAFGTLMKAFSRQTDWRRTLACLETMNEMALEDKSEICYSTAIFACGKAYRCQEALDLLNELKRKQGKVTSHKTFISAIYACAKAGQYAEAQHLLREMESGEGKDTIDLFAYNLAIHVCTRSRDEEGVLHWFDKMTRHKWVEGLDITNTCAVVMAYGATGRFEDGLAFIESVLASSSERFISSPAYALFVLRATQAGRGEEVVERLMQVLKKYDQPILPFVYGACTKALAGSGQYAKGLSMSVADAPWRVWRGGKKEGEEEEEGSFSTSDFVRTQLAFVQMKETPWPLAWWMVDGLAARGILDKEGLKVATAALVDKEAFGLCEPRLQVYKEKVEAEEVEKDNEDDKEKEEEVVEKEEENEEEEEDVNVHIYHIMVSPLAALRQTPSCMPFVGHVEEEFALPVAASS